MVVYTIKNIDALETRCRTSSETEESIMAHKAVANAISRGDIPKAAGLSCQSCGQQAKDYHHINGYSLEHWLDIIPLCRRCHQKTKKSPGDVLSKDVLSKTVLGWHLILHGINPQVFTRRMGMFSIAQLHRILQRDHLLTLQFKRQAAAVLGVSVDTLWPTAYIMDKESLCSSKMEQSTEK